MSPDLQSIHRNSNTVKDKIDEKRVPPFNILDPLHSMQQKKDISSLPLEATNRLAKATKEHEMISKDSLFDLNRVAGTKPSLADMSAEVGLTSKLNNDYHYTTSKVDNNSADNLSKDTYEQNNNVSKSENENATEKPNHSYISLIACAVLASPEKRLVLSDIYNFILENFSYFRNKGPGWRNSIRHNLSLNECFIKAGRSPNGKGHYWAIHPNNYEDFLKGDFRRRRAQRRTKRMIGLPDLDDAAHPLWYQPYALMKDRLRSEISPSTSPYSIPPSAFRCPSTRISPDLYRRVSPSRASPSRYDTTPLPRQVSKRGFDIDSLLKDDKRDRVVRGGDKSPPITPSMCYSSSSSCVSCTRDSCCRNEKISSYSDKLSSYSEKLSSYSSSLNRRGHPSNCDCRLSPHSSMSYSKVASDYWSSSVRPALCTTQPRGTYCKSYRSSELLDFR